MTSSGQSQPDALDRIMRGHSDDGQRVTQMELFFDLVYVFAVTQLSHLLLDNLNVTGALHMLLLLLAVWWAWVYTAWITNWFDPNHFGIRVMLIGVMLASLVMAAVLPEAFGSRGLVFAITYALMQIGRSLIVVISLHHDGRLRRNFERILAWSSAAGMLWIAGGFAGGPWRDAVWIAAVVIDYLAPAMGFVTPGLGRSVTTDWNIDGGHIAERCQNFVIIAFGESIVVTGASIAEKSFSLTMLGALVVAFFGSVALWWLYFNRAAEDSSRVIAASDDPGRLGRNAFTYVHLPIVAGIVVCAVGDELAISHTTAQASANYAAVVLGGPILFLAGHALFKWIVFDHVPRPHIVAITVLAALGAISLMLNRLELASLALLILAAICVWYRFAGRAAAGVASVHVPAGEIAFGDPSE